MTLFRLNYLLFLLFFLFINCSNAFSWDCPELTQVGNKKIAYGKRGNRCEGFYRSKVSAGSLDMVSLVRGRFHFALKENEVIEVASSIASKETINVRAVGIPMKMYYRMDAQLAAGQKLNWPVRDVIYPQKIKSVKIGIYGWTGSGKKKTYIPVRTTAHVVSGTQDNRVRLVFRSSVDVQDTQWRIFKWTDSGCSQRKNWKKLKISSYSSGQPITVELTEPELSKICVEMAAWDISASRWLKRKVHIRLK